MEVQHRIIPSQEEISLVVDIIKMVTPINQEGIGSAQLLEAIVLAMSKFNDTRIGFNKVGDKILIDANESFINKGEANQVTVREIIDYLLVENIIYKYKQNVEYKGHTLNLTHYALTNK